MHFLAIVGVSIVAAVFYGIAHDQVTARINMEYFSIGHPTIPGLDYDNPTMVAIVWGTIATWWVGLGLGIVLGIAARAGSRPKLVVRDLIRPIAVLLAAMAACSLLGGAIGYLLAVNEVIWLVPHLAERVEHHVSFLAVGGAHLAAYIAGGIGGLILATWVWCKRGRLAQCHEHVASTVDPLKAAARKPAGKAAARRAAARRQPFPRNNRIEAPGGAGDPVTGLAAQARLSVLVGFSLELPCLSHLCGRCIEETDRLRESRFVSSPLRVRSRSRDRKAFP